MIRVHREKTTIGHEPIRIEPEIMIQKTKHNKIKRTILTRVCSLTQKLPFPRTLYFPSRVRVVRLPPSWRPQLGP